MKAVTVAVAPPGEGPGNTLRKGGGKMYAKPAVERFGNVRDLTLASTITDCGAGATGVPPLCVKGS